MVKKVTFPWWEDFQVSHVKCHLKRKSLCNNYALTFPSHLILFIENVNKCPNYFFLLKFYLFISLYDAESQSTFIFRFSILWEWRVVSLDGKVES